MLIFSIPCAGKVPDISNVLLPFMRDGILHIPLTVGNGKIIDGSDVEIGSTKRGSSKSTTMSDDDICIALFMDGGILSNAVTVTFSNALPARSVIIGADGFVVLNTICGVALDFSELKSEISSVVSFRMLSSSIKNTVDDDVIDMLVMCASDYTVSFAPGQTSTVSTVRLSSDPTEVIISMQIPFGTGDTPTIEQTGEILNTNGEDVSLGKITAEDRAPPYLVSAASLSTSSIKVTFSEKMAPPFTAVDRIQCIRHNCDFYTS